MLTRARFQRWVTAQDRIVTGAEDALKENVEADREQKELVASFSYNIDLMMGKNKLISDVPIEKMSREADSVEVIFVKDGSNIMSYIGRLRKKIGLEAGKNIQTVWGIGYRFAEGDKEADSAV